MSTSNIIKYANKVAEICCQYGKTIKINIPKIKVVGSQSSGKSTLIKRIVEYDVLPMGDNMVTRTPIHVRLHTAENQEVTFKLSYLNESSITEELILKFQEGSKDSELKQNEFKQAIIKLTDVITKGQKYNISNIPIFIDIHSPKVINFAFVDLPGLIISPSVDKGQPRDLKLQIDNLVKQELSEPNTIALVVVKCGNDFATDLGIGLINDLKPLLGNENDLQTIGVLTKSDLLTPQDRDKLNFIIAGKVTNGDEMLSSSEMMTKGYFVVNNNVNSIIEEEKYFEDNFDKNKEIIMGERYSVLHLRNHLQTYLINEISKLMPEIKNNLNEILKNQKNRALQLGDEMETDQEKMKFVISTISELSRIIENTIRNDSSGNIHIGAKIGEIQKKFLINISNLEPFSLQKTSDTELQNIIDSFNGFHLTSHVSIEQLVDKCIKDPQKKPIMLIKPISEEYVKSIVSVLLGAIQQILSTSETIANINSYPKFKQLLHNTIIAHIQLYENKTNEFIQKNLAIEESFVWSTNQKFRENLNKHYLPKSNDNNQKSEKSTFMSSSALKNSTTFKTQTDHIDKSTLFQYNYEPSQIREIVSEYYVTIIERTRDYIIKIVINNMINELRRSITEQLGNLINTNDNHQSIISTIIENKSTAKERQTLRENIKKIEHIIKTTHNIKIDN